MYFDPACKEVTAPAKPIEAKVSVTKPDVWNVTTLISWLETKPPTLAYNYLDNHNCLLCRYLKAHGWERPFLTNMAAYATGEREVGPPAMLPAGFNVIARGHGAYHYSDHTFGSALERARRFAATGNV